MKKEYLRRFIKLAVQPMFHPRVPFKVRRILMKSAVLLQRKTTGSHSQYGNAGASQRLSSPGSPRQAKHRQAKHRQAKHRCCIYMAVAMYSATFATHRQVVDGIALIANATVWMPTYRLAPETSLSRCARRRFWRLPSLA